MKKRIKEIDMIKGLGILTIAAVHLIYRAKGGAVDHLLRSFGWLLIGLFFMLSGCTFKAGKRTVGQNYLYRLRKLMLPAVITEAALFVAGGVYCILFHGYTVSDCFHDVIVTILRPEICVHISEEWGHGGLLYDNLSPSWFIWTMLWTELAFFPIAEWCGGGKRKARWWISVIVLIAVQIPVYTYVTPVSWLLQLVPLFTVFMLIGAKIREAGLIEREWKLNTVLTALIAVAGLAASVGVFSLGGDNYYLGFVGKYGNGIDVLLPIIQLVPGTVGFYALSKLIMKLRVLSDAVAWTGRHTMTILMCHCFFGMIAADVLHTYIRMGPMWYLEESGLSLTPGIFWKSAAGLLISVGGCVLLCFAVDKIKDSLSRKT